MIKVTVEGTVEQDFKLNRTTKGSYWGNLHVLSAEGKTETRIAVCLFGDAAKNTYDTIKTGDLVKVEGKLKNKKNRDGELLKDQYGNCLINLVVDDKGAVALLDRPNNGGCSDIPF